MEIFTELEHSIHNCKFASFKNKSSGLLLGCRGNLRVFFIFHIDIENDCVGFEYLLNRGEAYKKETEDKLRKKDN